MKFIGFYQADTLANYLRTDEPFSFMQQNRAPRNHSSQFLFKLKLYLPFIVVCGIIFWLSSLSHPPIPNFMKFRNGDKVLHLIAFFFVGFAAVLPLAYHKTRFKWWLGIRALALAAIYAGLDEVHQAFVPMRDSSYLDFSADLVGASLGILVFWLMIKLSRTAK